MRSWIDDLSLQPSFLSIAISILIAQLVFYAQSVYLHRCLAHRSVELHRSVRVFFRAVIWLFLGSSPRHWVATHRLHHTFADTPRDPHSPLFEGVVGVAVKGARLVRKACKDGAAVKRLTRDLPDDPFEKLPNRARHLGILVSIGAFCLLLDPMQTAWIYGLSYVQILIGVAIVNGLGHMPGPAVSGHVGRNLPAISWWTAGESLHANHHARPGRTFFSLTSWQFDPGWRLIALLSLAGLAHPRFDRSIRSTDA